MILCWWITNMTMLTLNLQVRICTLRTLKRLKKTKDIVLEGWEQVTLKGDKKWQGKIYSNNGYAQFSANNFEGEVDTWFISPAVAVTSKDAGLSFDIKFGYYNADCLDVLVSDTYAGNGSIDMAQWTSVKDQFTFPEGPANGYNDNFVNVGKSRSGGIQW